MTMSLQHATIDQLLQWQADLMEEIAMRCRGANRVEAPRAPWEMQAPQSQPPQYIDDRAGPASEIIYLRQQLAAAQRNAAPPAMLGGQQPPQHRIRPGVVIATDRTEPKMAGVFAGVVPRLHDNLPGVQGNGRGEGHAEFNMPGANPMGDG